MILAFFGHSSPSFSYTLATPAFYTTHVHTLGQDQWLLTEAEKVPSIEPALLHPNIIYPQMYVVIYLLGVMDSYT